MENSGTNLDNTPWTYYNYVFRQPIEELQSNANFGRYENAEAWDLTQQLGRTAVTDPAIQEPLSPARGDLAHRDAGDPDVVQRLVVAGQQRRTGRTGPSGEGAAVPEHVERTSGRRAPC